MAESIIFTLQSQEMNFSKTTSYAISVLSFMADHDGKTYSAKKLNELLEIPRPYLRQLLTNLSKSGFIYSTQGRNGGFRLHKPADQIFLAEIIDSVEGLNVLDTCIMGFKKCPFNHSCAMHEVWEETRDNILMILNDTTLDQLIKPGKRP
ncbi:MAG: Rrf2 family transcriptional regulator [Bacteroidales bacterium]|nr:Rrf2 family transcriptional regulator [Bacteroidales bacterium]